MEEKNYGINWLGLFIKVIVFVVVVLLAIWLISKITLRNKGLSFEENNKKFQDATVEYFKKNLPEEGKSSTVTLSQLISWDYLKELKNEDGKICDIKNSKSKIEVVDDYYSIKTTLVCSNKSETKYIKLGNENCTKCDIKVDGLEVKTTEKEEKKENEKQEETTKKEESSKNNSTSINNSNTQTNVSNQNTSSNKNVLYEYVKYTTEYTDWYVGTVTGKNIENSTKKISYSEYCENETHTYYTVSYVTKKQSYTYKLELTNLDNVSSVKIKNDNYFTSYNDYKRYINNKYEDLEMVGGNTVSLPKASVIRDASLESDNFKYTISKVYKEKGKYYVDVTVTVKNLTGVTPYYESNIKSNIYYVPIKFTVSYLDKNDCIVDKTDNSKNYSDYTIIDTWTETVDIYRYKNVIPEYKYSSANSLSGYTKTGKTKLAS